MKDVRMADPDIDDLKRRMNGAREVLRDEFNGLSDADQQKVMSFLADSGCEQIL